MKAPWIQQQLTALLAQRGHAWLVHGPSGLGQYSLALELAKAWLCEHPSEDGACENCTSCHAISVRTHADCCVLMPEVSLLALGWPLSEKAQAEVDDKKRKASKEIRVEAMRDAVEFSQRTSARGRGKVVLVYPAEQMNHITANALLKTLEEPPGDVRFILASESAHQLLPTIRSRCISHTMVWPNRADSLAWLTQQGVEHNQAAMLLKATGGRVEDAVQFRDTGRDGAAWAGLAKAMQRGDTAFVKDWSAPQLIDALHKLCHDMMTYQCGAEPRFFDAASLCKAPPLRLLSAWSKELSAAMRTMEHPFNAGLMQEALVAKAKSALNSHA